MGRRPKCASRTAAASRYSTSLGGYDEGDGFAHITTNISPSVAGANVDFFYTSDIVLVRDPSGTVLLPQD